MTLPFLAADIMPNSTPKFQASLHAQLMLSLELMVKLQEWITQILFISCVLHKPKKQGMIG